MRVTVEFFGPARDAVGVSRTVVDCEPPCSAEELAVRLARQHGGRLATLLLQDNRLAPSILIAVNDRQDGKVLLRDGDEVTVIPPISGGAD